MGITCQSGPEINSSKRIAFAAEVQGKPKSCRALKEAKRQMFFRQSFCQTYMPYSQLTIVVVTSFPIAEGDSGSKFIFSKIYM